MHLIEGPEERFETTSRVKRPPRWIAKLHDLTSMIRQRIHHLGEVSINGVWLSSWGRVATTGLLYHENKWVDVNRCHVQLPSKEVGSRIEQSRNVILIGTMDILDEVHSSRIDMWECCLQGRGHLE